MQEKYRVFTSEELVDMYQATQDEAALQELMVRNNGLIYIKNKDYFVLTTNVDHQFQRTGFDKKRLFYTQGDYGLWQCSRACHNKTYDNEVAVRQMVAEQQNMKIPTGLIPKCPVCRTLFRI